MRRPHRMEESKGKTGASVRRIVVDPHGGEVSAEGGVSDQEAPVDRRSGHDSGKADLRSGRDLLLDHRRGGPAVEGQDDPDGLLVQPHPDVLDEGR